MLVVTGDPRRVMSDLEQQAARLGMPFLTSGATAPFTCAGFDGEDFARSVKDFRGDTSAIEGYSCAAYAANEPETASLGIDLKRFRFGDQLAVSHLILRYATEGPPADWSSRLFEPNDRAPLPVPQPWPRLPEEGEILSPAHPLDVVRVEEGSEVVGPPHLRGPAVAAGEAMLRITGDRDSVIAAYQRQFTEIAGSGPEADTSVMVTDGELRTWHHPGAGGHSIGALVFGSEPSWLYISVTYD